MAKEQVDLTYKRGDTAEPLRATLESLDIAKTLEKGEEIFKAVDLSDAFVIRVYLYTAKTEKGEQRWVKTAPVEVVGSAEAGEVEYPWEEDDLARAGLYQAEFEITFIDGRVLTLPNDSYLTIQVLEDLGPNAREE
jgi:hypothetical protein